VQESGEYHQQSMCCTMKALYTPCLSCSKGAPSCAFPLTLSQHNAVHLHSIRKLPAMLQFVNIRVERCWNAVWAPHSGGRVPDSLLSPSCRYVSDGKEALPQDAGSVPLRGKFLRTRMERAGKAPAPPHSDGRLPVNVTQGH